MCFKIARSVGYALYKQYFKVELPLFDFSIDSTPLTP